MSTSTQPNPRQPMARFVEITKDEQERESALRQRFATYWATTAGEPRAIYDQFISNSPLVGGIALEEVGEKDVMGWWVRPPQASPRQAILYLHGGGYVQGTAKAYRGFASQIASRTHLPVLVIDYPLAPEAKVPSAPRAALAAYFYLVDQGYEQIAVVGDSAGGNLTLVTLQQLALQARRPAPVAGVAFSPWTDMAFTGASYRDPNIVDPLIGLEFLKQCAASVLGDTKPTDPIASPLYGNFEGLPPLLLQVGADELLLDDSRRFAENAAQAGVPVELDVWEGMHHVFQLDVSHLESSKHALDRTAHFLLGAFGSRT